MRKILFTACLLASLCSCAFAKGGETLPADEAVADRVATSIATDKGYTAVIKDFLPGASKEFTEAKYAEAQKEIADKFGKVTDLKMVGYNRNIEPGGNYNNVNQVALLGRASKGGFVSFIVTVANSPSGSKVIGVGLVPVKVEAR